MKRIPSILLATVLAAATGVAAANTTLTVYTALEADQIKAYQAAFEKAHPDIRIQWVRDSTGIVAAKLLAEKNNPKADVIWGLAGTALGLMDKEGMLLPYAPKGLDQIAANMRDGKDVPAWVGMDAYAAAVCVNTIEASKQNLPMPTSWQDLTKPEYAGKIVMPNPASSGTGFLDVSAWLQMFGEEKGWAFMDALHKNMGSYTHSGSKPCNMAAAGEYPIGISFDYRAAKLKADGAPVEAVFPSEGLGWEVEATAIVKGTKHLEAARKLADLEPAEPVVRYEHQAPGDLLHIDIKKLGRIQRPGHRVTGNRRDTVEGAGWDFVFVAIDDHARVAFTDIHPDERFPSAVQFLKDAVAYYQRLGVTIQRLLTDNGSAFRSRAFAALCHELGIKHRFTRPYRPQTNGKAERFIQSALREWAYAHTYQNSQHRADAMKSWLHHYNWHRPHQGIGRAVPISRLNLDKYNLLTVHN
ncbi:periplasmic protein [Bordetella pertussis]|nr:putative 2-aminoethylphosphonate ABC transporter substrate-binding protein [Bordetella pertussis]CPI50951.1 periplasmic protein [Bordetella pertussis]